MQTQIQPSTSTEIPSIAAQVARAQAQLATLQSATTEAEAEAKRWQIAFEAEPTEQGSATAAVWKQKAINARKAAEVYERETLQPLVLQERAAASAKLRAELDRQETAAQRRFDASIDGIVAGLREFYSAIDELATLHDPRVHAQREGVALSQLSLTTIVEGLNSKLDEFKRTNSYDAKGAYIQFSSPTSGDACVEMKINIPVGSVPSPLR